MKNDFYIDDILWVLWYSPLLTMASLSGGAGTEGSVAFTTGYLPEETQSPGKRPSRETKSEAVDKRMEERGRNCVDAAWDYYCRLLPVWNGAGDDAVAINRLSFGNA